MKKEKFWWSKSDDNFLSQYFSRPISRRVTLFLSRFSFITPNCITVFSLVIDITAALLIVKGFRILPAALIWISFIFDCVDGELARLTNRKSTFGQWLDAELDLIKEIILFFALGLKSYLSSGNHFVFLFLSLVIATRYILNGATTRVDLFWLKGEGKKRKEWFGGGVVYKISHFFRLPPQYFEYTEDIIWAIFIFGVLCSKYLETLWLFLFIHIALFLFVLGSLLVKR